MNVASTHNSNQKAVIYINALTRPIPTSRRITVVSSESSDCPWTRSPTWWKDTSTLVPWCCARWSWADFLLSSKIWGEAQVWKWRWWMSWLLGPPLPAIWHTWIAWQVWTVPLRTEDKWSHFCQWSAFRRKRAGGLVSLMPSFMKGGCLRRTGVRHWRDSRSRENLEKKWFIFFYLELENWMLISRDGLDCQDFEEEILMVVEANKLLRDP